MGLDDGDVSSVALDDGPVLSVGQGAGPGGAVGVDEEQNLGRGRSPLDDGLVQALQGQQVPVVLLDVRAAVLLAVHPVEPKGDPGIHVAVAHAMGPRDLLALGLLVPMDLAVFVLDVGVELDGLGAAARLGCVLLLDVVVQPRGQSIGVDLLLDHDLGDGTHRVTTHDEPVQVNDLDAVFCHVQQDVATYQQVLERFVHRGPAVGHLKGRHAGPLHLDQGGVELRLDLWPLLCNS